MSTGYTTKAEDGATAFDLIWKALRGRRTYADLTTAFKAVSIAPDLLRDPVTLSRSRNEMRVFAGAARDRSRNRLATRYIAMGAGFRSGTSLLSMRRASSRLWSPCAS